MKFVFEDGKIELYVPPRHMFHTPDDIITHEYTKGEWGLVEAMPNTPINMEYAQNWLDGADENVKVPAVKGARNQYMNKGFEIICVLSNGAKVVLPDKHSVDITCSFRDAMVEMLQAATFEIEVQDETS